MIEIGRYNTLKIVKKVPFGMYLDGKELGEILLPAKYTPANSEPGDELEVFIYLDSEERLIATTLKPVAQVGKFALMTVVANGKLGAFLKWGIEKDLFVAHKEQKSPLVIGKSYIFYVYFDDESGRIAASQKIHKYLLGNPEGLKAGDEVEILVYEKSPFGWKAIINDMYPGVLYQNEVFDTSIKVGFKSRAFIKKIREDLKIDLSLQKSGYGMVRDFSDVLFEKLIQNDGYLSFNDNSSPELIYSNFGVSKKVFKKAVGSLYRNRRINITKDGGIELIR